MARKVPKSAPPGQFAALTLAAALLASCGGEQPAPEGDGAEPATESRRNVLPGVDVLVEDSLHLVRGRAVGLITNHTGISARPGAGDAPRSSVALLHEHPEIDLVALYGPEHGLVGRAKEGELIESGRHEATGLPIYSLYGADRKPAPEMLEGVEALLFDIQDVGARYYTYVWTMALAMEAAGEAGIPFIVLDRPNPIGGHLVQGNVLDPAFATFVGLYPVPMRHGLTAGELARVLVGEMGVDVELHVVPVQGWSRAMWYDETGLTFVPPSPNMPSLESATHYPGTCLFEGTNLSVGRGTDRAFQQIGAPWLDAEALATELNGMVEAGLLEGVRVEAVRFTPASPSDGKFGGQEVRGLRFVAIDRDRYDPTRTAIAALIAVHARHDDALRWNVSHFDRLAGTDRVREEVVAGGGLEEVTAGWAAESAAFEALRRPYLIY